MDNAREAFERVLDEILRQAAAATDGSSLLVQAVGPGGSDLGPVLGAGGESRWDLAMDWAEKPVALEPPSITAPPPECVDPVEFVRRELGLSAGLTQEQLAESWRAFVWRHHPDRKPPGARDEANARVALANALYDRARRALRRG